MGETGCGKTEHNMCPKAFWRNSTTYYLKKNQKTKKPQNEQERINSYTNFWTTKIFFTAENTTHSFEIDSLKTLRSYSGFFP